MVLNYVLLGITGILAISGILEMVKGSAGHVKPVYETAGAIQGKVNIKRRRRR
jgi:hypothetical protein